MYFKLKPKVGSHAETGQDGKVIHYRPEDGHVFETDRDLVAMFPNKFERVHVPGDEGAEDEASPPKPKKESKPKKDDAPPPKPLGRDVTKRFPKAAEEDFKVFSDGGAFFVAEADEPTVALNEKPLKKKDVIPFIKEYLE
jgi:hypothetical protein